MQVGPLAWGSARHRNSELCRRRMEQREQHAAAQAGARALEQNFTAYGEELRKVEQFRYLGRLLSFDDNDTPAIRRQLKRARGQWARISKVIGKEEVPGPVAGMFYQAVVAAVLLYGSESWVTSPAALARLEGFHVESARRMTGRRPKKVRGVWSYPDSEEVLRAARLQPIEVYIKRRRRTVLKAVEGRPILEECREAERMRGSPTRSYWWEQEFELTEEETEEGTPPRPVTPDNHSAPAVRPRFRTPPTEQTRIPRDLPLTEGEEAELDRRMQLAALPT